MDVTTAPAATEYALRVEDLHVHFRTAAGVARAVNGVSFSIRRGERFGLVGESGSGKSTTANAILRLIKPPGVIAGGRVVVDGVDLLRLGDGKMREMRWTKLALIMQGAMNSLNPLLRVGDQIADGVYAHVERKAAERTMDGRLGQLLKAVGLPERVARMYPHELSGGMKQRACIAMAMALEPSLIIADEPTSALDVVMQRIVAQTLIEVGERLGASLLMIGHDMGLQARLVHRIGIMYAGDLVEVADVADIFRRPQHPYTQLLISSVPSLKERRMPVAIPGLPPSPVRRPSGCPFHPRCPYAMPVCREVTPVARELAPGHVAACHLYGEASA